MQQLKRHETLFWRLPIHFRLFLIETIGLFLPLFAPWSDWTLNNKEVYLGLVSNWPNKPSWLCWLMLRRLQQLNVNFAKKKGVTYHSLQKEKEKDLSPEDNVGIQKLFPSLLMTFFANFSQKTRFPIFTISYKFELGSERGKIFFVYKENWE
jgi:hypothetical protein